MAYKACRVKSHLVQGSANRFLNFLHNIPHILICHIRPRWKSHTNLEDCLGDTVHVGRDALVDGLLMHRFPDRTGFDTSFVQEDAEGVDVVVGLTVGGGAVGHMDDTGGTIITFFTEA